MSDRRWLELREAGHDITEAAVLDDVRIRDERDSARTDAPLKPADDAVTFDTTKLDIDAALERAIDIVQSALEART